MSFWRWGRRIERLEYLVKTNFDFWGEKMVTRQDFDAAMLAAHTAMNDLARRVDADLKAKDDALAAKDATIADLQAQLAAAVPLTDADLAGVQALALNANAIDPAPPVA